LNSIRQYDRSITDLFELQDDIARSVAASTQTQVAEGLAVMSRPSTDFKARDLTTKAWGRFWDQTPEGKADASNLVEESLRIDPMLPRAHQLRAVVFVHRMWFEEIPANAANTALALELAGTALRLAPQGVFRV
jgi:adenylate cyclase